MMLRRNRVTVPPPSCPIVGPSNAAYNADHLDFNQWCNADPQAIVYCQSEQDVAASIAWAQSLQVPLSVRSGRHSYEAFSLCTGVVIDLGQMNTIAVDPDTQTATAGPGIQLLPFYQALAPYNLAFPGGSCGTVGLSGLVLGGGFGLLSRKFGLSCDNLLGLRMVDASGQTVVANQTENADLLWACQGGGWGSFGVITELTLQLHP